MTATVLSVESAAPAPRSASRKAAGFLLAAVAGSAFAASIVTSADQPVCELDLCIASGPPAFVLGAVGVVIFLAALRAWGWALAIGPLSGLTAAGILLHRQGVDVVQEHLGAWLFIVAGTALGPGIIVMLSHFGGKNIRYTGDVVAKGHRGVAHVIGARQTSVYVGDRPQVAIDFTIQPLDRSRTFSYREVRTLDITDVVPRPGLAWPAWYDPQDQSRVVVRRATGGAVDAEVERMYEDFGLSLIHGYGYDPVHAMGSV